MPAAYVDGGGFCRRRPAGRPQKSEVRGQGSEVRVSRDCPDRRAAWAITLVSCAIGLFWCVVTVRCFESYVFRTWPDRTWAVADDVYISADFARTFASGGGLRWYPGAPKVEGFSNPLWVLLLAAFHRLPGFSEARLGLYVLAAQIAMLVWLAAVFGRGLRALAATVSLRERVRPWRVAVAIALAPGGLALCVWTSSGYEVVLVALISLAAYVESLRAPEPPREWLVGVLVGLAFWARMDSLLASTAAIITVCFRGTSTRRLLAMFAIVVAMVGALLVGRHAYYGEWLPNTYYLKVTGWPLAKRWPQGLFQNQATIVSLFATAVPFLGLSLTRMGRVAWGLAVGLLPFVLEVLYSTYIGGDVSFHFGYDRFGATGWVFLLFVLTAVVLFCPVRGRYVVLFIAGALASALAPPLRADPRLVAMRGFFQLEKPVLRPDILVAIWIKQGRVLEEVTLPGARIAVCAAGALIYFSHRGGVDLLGKVDPYVARLKATETRPPEARCWRGFPGAGHNKEDSIRLFALRQPDVSMVRPPQAEQQDWVVLEGARLEFFARRDDPFVLWNRVRLVGPVH
jgi:hypothetical protein